MIRVLKRRIIGRIVAPEVSRIIYMLEHLPSHTVCVEASGSPVCKEGDTIIVSELSPVSNYGGALVAGDSVVVCEHEVLAVIQADGKLVPGPGKVLAKDEGPVDRRIVQYGSSTLYGIPHYYLVGDKRYIAKNTTGWVVNYKGDRYSVLPENELLAEVEDDVHSVVR